VASQLFFRDKVQYDFLKNLPFQNAGKVKDHDADEFMDLDKEGFHAFVKAGFSKKIIFRIKLRSF